MRNSKQSKMAADKQSKSDFTSILSRIDRKFNILHTKWTTDKCFEAKFRTQIPKENEDYNRLCDEWVDLFAAVTSTTWVKKTSNTAPQIKFRKQYQCWTHPGDVQKELLFDPRKCKATVDVKVPKDNPASQRNAKYIKQGLNIVVKLNFVHLHSIETTKPFAFFVHDCEPLRPQPDVPRSTTPKANQKLPRIISNIVVQVKHNVPKTDELRDENHSNHECQYVDTETDIVEKLEHNVPKSDELRDENQTIHEYPYEDIETDIVDVSKTNELSDQNHSIHEYQYEDIGTETDIVEELEYNVPIADELSDENHAIHEYQPEDIETDIVPQTDELSDQNHSIHEYQYEDIETETDIVEKLEYNVPITDELSDENHAIHDYQHVNIETGTEFQLMTSEAQSDHLNMIQLNPILSLQNMETLKLQVLPQMQPFTQVYVTAPQFQEVLMCQPALMFDPNQMIQVSNTFTPQFVQVHSYNWQPYHDGVNY